MKKTEKKKKIKYKSKKFNIDTMFCDQWPDINKASKYGRKRQ